MGTISKKEEIFNELIEYHTNHLRIFDRLQEYLTENPRATLADIERDVYRSREVIEKAEHNVGILYEFFGLKPPRRHPVTHTRRRTKCEPVDRTKIKPQIVEPEDTDVQLPPYKLPEQSQESPSQEPYKNPRNKGYSPEELETIMSEMRKGTPLAEIEQKTGRPQGGLIFKMAGLSRKRPREFDPAIIRPYARDHYRANQTKYGPKTKEPNLERDTTLEDIDIDKVVEEDIKSSKKRKRMQILEHPQQSRSYDHVPKKLMQTVREIVAQSLSVPLENVSPNTHLINELGGDDSNQAELYQDLEERLGVEIREDETDPFDNPLMVVGGIAEYIMNWQKSQKRKTKQPEESQEIMQQPIEEPQSNLQQPIENQLKTA